MRFPGASPSAYSSSASSGKPPIATILGSGITPSIAGVCERISVLPAQRYVYDFDEPSEGGRELLGGKGAGLAEMTQMGVPVPAGFTITTDACRAYMSSGKALPDGLDEEIDRHLGGLEEKTGKRFGDA